MFDLDKAWKRIETYYYSSPKTWDELGVHMMHNVIGADYDFYRSGAFDLKIGKVEGTSKACLDTMPTAEFVAALKSRGLHGEGIAHLLSRKIVMKTPVNNVNIVDLMKIKNKLDHGDLYKNESWTLMSSGIVEVTSGVITILPKFQKRVDTYKERATKHCKGVIEGNWKLLGVRCDYESGAIEEVEFVCREPSYNWYKMTMPAEKTGVYSTEGTKTCLNAAEIIPEQFYKVLAKAFPECMHTLLPVAILNGFTQLRELL